MAPARQPQANIPIPIPLPGAPPIHVHVPGTGGNDGIGLPNPGNIIHGAQDVGHFLGALTNPNTWIRVAEVTVGVILIAVGISAMLRIDVAGTVGKGAKMAALL